MKSIPQHCTLQHKMNYGIRAGPDLFRSISVLGWGSSLVGGRVQFGSLLLKTNHINPRFWWKF